MPRSQKQKMPNCSYGVACTRKDCIYTHPPRPAAAPKKKTVKVEVSKTGRPCLAFLSGLCTFGGLCRDEHPSDPDEVARLIESFSCRPCRFGSSCHTIGCLYKHPALPSPPAEDQNSSVAHTSGTPSPEVQTYFPIPQQPPPPPSPLETLVAFFERVGDPSMAQKAPAMLARFQGSEESLFASLEAKYGQPVVDASQTVNRSGAGGGEDVSHSFSALHLDARATAPNSHSASAVPHEQARVPSSSAAPHTKAPAASAAPQVWPKKTSPPLSSRADASLPWAPSNVDRGNPPSSSAGGWGGGGSARSGGTSKASAVPTVPIPIELWTLDVARDPAVFAAHTDPLERFAAVNGSLHGSTSSNGNGNGGSEHPGNRSNGTGGRQLGVLDLHFQSTRTFPAVLDTLLDNELMAVKARHAASAQHRQRDRSGGAGAGGGGCGGGTRSDGRPMVWLVTGTGHHTGQTHVKAGSLYDGVEAYLSERGYEFARGRDKAGRSGAFAVYPWQ